jgi:hypothetical protein
LHKTKGIGQNDILNELYLHGHPKSRQIKLGNKLKQRVTHKAPRELAVHYIYLLFIYIFLLLLYLIKEYCLSVCLSVCMKPEIS